MLMTDGVGKAGGQSIQRRGAIRVLRNITIPTQRRASLMNPQRFVASFLFSVWSTYGIIRRDQWAIIGNNLRGLTIWGDEKGFSGREAFLKTQMLIYAYDRSTIDPVLFDYTVPSLESQGLELSSTNQTLKWTIVAQSGSLFYQMKALRNRSGAVNPNVEKLLTFYRSIDYTDQTENFSQLEASIGSVGVGAFVSIAIRGISASGLPTPWILYNLQAT
jgi:hypothetical protein